MGLPFRFETVPDGWIRSPAPTLGRHNHEVLAQELGLPPEELADLEQSKIVGTRPIGV